MALHYKIENWKDQKWYSKLMNRGKWILKYSSGNASSDVFEKYLRDAQLNFKMDANQGKQRDALRQRAKVVTKKKYDNYVY